MKTGDALQQKPDRSVAPLLLMRKLRTIRATVADRSVGGRVFRTGAANRGTSSTTTAA